MDSIKKGDFISVNKGISGFKDSPYYSNKKFEVVNVEKHPSDKGRFIVEYINSKGNIEKNHIDNVDKVEAYAKGSTVKGGGVGDTIADRYARLTKTEAKRLDELSKKVRINEQTDEEDIEWDKLVHKYRGWDYKGYGKYAKGSTIKGEYEKTNKIKAKKLFDIGETVYLSNGLLGGSKLEVKKGDFFYHGEFINDFDKIVSDFKSYNKEIYYFTKPKYAKGSTVKGGVPIMYAKHWGTVMGEQYYDIYLGNKRWSGGMTLAEAEVLAKEKGVDLVEVGDEGSSLYRPDLEDYFRRVDFNYSQGKYAKGGGVGEGVKRTKTAEEIYEEEQQNAMFNSEYAKGGVIPYALRKRVENVKKKFGIEITKEMGLQAYHWNTEGMGGSGVGWEIFGQKFSIREVSRFNKRDSQTVGDTAIVLGEYYSKYGNGGMTSGWCYSIGGL